ncbi:MAG: hypothetical protein Q7S24_00475 [bacterium]|nr:hypothetical protein [bacterium]
MTTIINTPGTGSSDSSMMGTIIGLVVLVVLVALFFVYGLPMLRGASGATNTKNSNAAPNTTNVQFPDKIDVTVTK